MSDNENLAGLAVQLAALATLVAQQARDIGELMEWRASIEAQEMNDEVLPAVDLSGNPIRSR